MSVAIGLNSPRTSAGASGLRSKVASCDGPPPMNSRMHAFALPKPLAEARFGGEAVARRRSSAGRAKPPAPSPPMRRKLRRVTPYRAKGGGGIVASPFPGLRAGQLQATIADLLW